MHNHDLKPCGTPQSHVFPRRTGADARTLPIPHPKNSPPHHVPAALFDSCHHVRFLIATLLGLALALSAACAPDSQTSSSLPGFANALFEAPAAPSGWAIHLARVDPSTAAGRLEATRALPGLGDAYLLDRGGSLFIAIGRYDDPRSDRAQREFNRVRALEVSGRRPFAGAFMLPPPPPPVTDPLDLRSARRGNDLNTIYALQIEAHVPESSGRSGDRAWAQAKATSERRVRELRESGEDAYYFHGEAKRISIVAVGVFGIRDLDTSVSPPIESQRLRDTRARFPTSKLNGQPAVQLIRGPSGRPVEAEQPSFLIEIPTS